VRKKGGKKIGIGILLGLFLLIPVVYALPSITLDKDVYFSEESSVAEMEIGDNTEKNDPYNVTWYYPNGTIIGNCQFTGTTPGGVGLKFYETCNLPIIHQNFTNAFATLWVDTPTNNATDYFNLTKGIAPGALTLTNLVLKNKYIFLGDKQTLRGTVLGTSERLAGVTCDIQIRRPDETPIGVVRGIESDGNGEAYGAWYLNPENYEIQDYIAKLSCWCDDSESYTCQQYGETRAGSSRVSFHILSHVTNYDAILPVTSSKNLNATIDKVKIFHNQTNELGKVLTKISSFWFTNVDTGMDYHYDSLNDLEGSLNLGNSQVTYELTIPTDLDTGEYRVEIKTSYYYRGSLREYDFLVSESFNITSAEDLNISTTPLLDREVQALEQIALLLQNLTINIEGGNMTFTGGNMSVTGFPDYTSTLQALVNTTAGNIPLNYTTLWDDLINVTENNQPINYSTYYSSLISSIQANTPINYTSLFNSINQNIANNKPINYTNYWNALVEATINQTNILSTELKPINYSLLYNNLINVTEGNKPINYTTYWGLLIDSQVDLKTKLFEIKGVMEDAQENINIAISTPDTWIANNSYTVYARITDFAGNAFDPSSIKFYIKDVADNEIFYIEQVDTLGSGLYKHTFEVPENALEGTYTIYVKASDGTLLATDIKQIEILGEKPRATWEVLEKIEDIVSDIYRAILLFLFGEEAIET